MKRHKMPKDIFVYVFDEDEDGQPLWAIATDIEQIPEDASGQRIGKYKLDGTSTFVVMRKFNHP